MPTSSVDARAALSAVPMFAGLTPRHLSAVAKLVKPVTHQPGTEVASQGRGAMAFHVITDGTATVTVNGTPRRMLVAGDYFGEISLLDGEPRSATVTAGDGGLSTLALGRSAFLGLVESEASLARAVIAALCGRIRALESL